MPLIFSTLQLILALMTLGPALGADAEEHAATQGPASAETAVRTMADPYRVLDVPSDSPDEVIRRRYLTLVRTYTPERAPERFAAIREAYEKLRDPVRRLHYRLFEVGQEDSLEALVTDAKTCVPCRRLAVAELLALGRKYA